MKRAILTILVLVTASVCLAQQTKVENNTEFHSISLSAEDKQFLALKDTAQKHLKDFIESLTKHGADTKHYAFSVKSDFVENGRHEHMWSQVYFLKDEKFEGIFIDSPFDIKNIKTGDKVSIRKEGVEDWIIKDLKTGKQTGYFSEKYLNSKG